MEWISTTFQRDHPFFHDPDAVLCYGKTSIIDHEGRVIELYDDNLNLQQEKADKRFVQFFKSVGLTNVTFGLMRTMEVRKTALMGNAGYPSADVNFMAELALYGKFIEIPETLFYRRMHPGASSWNRKDDTMHVEFWTGKRGGYVLPNWKKNLAYLSAIRRAPIGKPEKLRLQSYILRRMVWQRQTLLREVIQGMRSRTT